MHNPSLASISALLSRQPAYLLEDDHHHHHGGKGDDDDKKRKREIFKKIAAKVLAYHGLPKAYTASELAQNSTLETGLKAEDGSYGGLHRRVRVEKSLLPPCESIFTFNIASCLRSSGQAKLLRQAPRYRHQSQERCSPHHQPPPYPPRKHL